MSHKQQATPPLNIERELDLARDARGRRLLPVCRNILRAVVESPTLANWKAAHAIQLAGRMTLWRAVVDLQIEYAAAGPLYDVFGNEVDGWQKVPPRELIIAAIRYATH